MLCRPAWLSDVEEANDGCPEMVQLQHRLRGQLATCGAQGVSGSEFESAGPWGHDGGQDLAGAALREKRLQTSLQRNDWR